MDNIYQYEISKVASNLTFSVWNKNVHQGHALFIGNLVEIFNFLKNKDITQLEVSILNLLFMESYDSLTAEEWLEWYYSFALFPIQRDFFMPSTLIGQSIKLHNLAGFSDSVTIGVN